MYGNSFAQEWSGASPWAPKHPHHRHDDDPREGERHGPGRHGHGPGRHGGGPRSSAKAAFARELAQQWAFTRGKGHGHHRPSPEELEELIAMRRMRGGPFSGSGPFGRGPRGRGRGRARRGDVRLAVLRLLAEEPSNGYQLMQAIEQRSDGRWRPSPGSIYPTLAQLEDEALIRSTEADGSRRFQITDAGREHLETRAAEPAPWEPQDEDGEHALSELGPVIISLGKAAWQVGSVGTADQRARAVELLAETQRAMYRILSEEPTGDAETDTDDSESSAG
ncbi:MAG: PadR family transcriptional regulator [Solirubrobacteraceae bacterium]